MMIKARGHEVIAFGRGDEALDAIRANPPDLVISDVRMSPVDGIQVMNAVRSMTPPVPIILITAYNNRLTEDSAREKGASAYLYKPFTMQQLVTAVDSVIHPAGTTEPR